MTPTLAPAKPPGKSTTNAHAGKPFGHAAGVAASEAALRQLELAVFRKLDGLLHGDYQGLLPGIGTESGEGHVYVPGDDVRRIDWNLTARSSVPHVRNTIADHELETWLVVDGSESLDFGTARYEKRELALAAAAAFGFLTSRAGNRIGAVLFDPAGTAVLPPRSGRAAVLALLHRLHTRPRAGSVPEREDRVGRASLSAALSRAGRSARRRGLVVVVSDFLDTDDWARELRGVATRHDVVVCHITDPRDAALPAVGLLTLVDPETGRPVEVQTDRRQTRERFAAAAEAQRAATKQAARSARAGYLPLSTDRDWLLDVVQYAAMRKRHR
jgi:uncharacterized protein (DUF58 family)